MSIKKLCSIGLLNIKLNLTLKKSFAEENNFNIDNYNKIEDLEQLYPHHLDSDSNKLNSNGDIDYINYISLSSDDNLLNTLFFINRAYKVKTFIEFLIPNEIKYNNSNHFIKTLVNEILCRNYFFVVENNIINKPSTIKFIIKIIKDENNEIISKKEFILTEEVEENEVDIFFNEYFEFYKLHYEFGKNDFFFIDLDSIKSLKWKTNNDLILFIINIIQNNNKLKLILSINENSLTKNDNNFDSISSKKSKEKNYDVLQTNKIIIESSDIIFCFKNPLNHFLKEYSVKNRTKIIKINDNAKYKLRSDSFDKFLNISNKTDINFNRNNGIDLIIYDNNKYRKNIQRLSIILDDFDYLTIYNQEFGNDTPMEVTLEPYTENFCFALLNKNHTNKEFKENKKILSKYSNKCFHVFIGGFLSRYINNIDSSGNVNSYEECFAAGNLMLKSYLILLKNNTDFITDIDEYNVVVPKTKKCHKERLYKERKEELRKIRQKEKKFILDCTNTSKSQKKDYNSLLDFNCSSYLLKKNILNHLTKHNFINQNGDVLEDPSNTLKSPYKQNVIKIDRAYYYNKYNNMYLNNTNYKKLTNKIISNENENNNEDEKYQFKRIFESYESNGNKLDNNYNKINNNNPCNFNKVNLLTNKFNYASSSDFIYKNSRTFYNNKLIYSNNRNIKKYNLYFKKKSYDVKKDDEHFIIRKNQARPDNSLNYLNKDYNAYLFKLYQPKKKYKTFLSNYESKKK